MKTSAQNVLGSDGQIISVNQLGSEFLLGVEGTKNQVLGIQRSGLCRSKISKDKTHF